MSEYENKEREEKEDAVSVKEMPRRDSTADNSDRETVRGTDSSGPTSSRRDGTRPLSTAMERAMLMSVILQDTFEDANDTAEITTPKRPSMERTRSLAKRPSSSKSNFEEVLDSDHPPVPAVQDMEVKEDKEEIPIVEEDVKQPNSPLLTSHRVSVSNSSLDNVNLHNVSLDDDMTPIDLVASQGTSKGRSLLHTDY